MTQPSELPEPLPTGYRIADRYLIDSELPRQTMGRTYKAADLGLHETIAINVLHSEPGQAERIKLFRRRFRKAFDKHYGKVFEYGEYLGVPFAVVAYEDRTGALVDVGVD